MFPLKRNRRLRQSAAIRALVRETVLTPNDFLVPLFVVEGFIGLNGCSLTIADIDKAAGTLQVCYIPETLRVTTHGEKQLGDKVNLEIDRQTQVIVDTVEAVMAEMQT